MEPKKTLKDIPLQEITIRRYESPVGMSPEELPRKFLLSVGLLQPGESRDIIVDIFNLLRKSKRAYEVHEILKELSGKKGASAPNIRRQLRRLRDLKFVEKTPDGYRICESFASAVENFIEPFIIRQTTERLKEYARQLDALNKD